MKKPTLQGALRELSSFILFFLDGWICSILLYDAFS